MDYDNEVDIFTLTGVAAAVICSFLAILFNGGFGGLVGCGLFLMAGAAVSFFFARGFSMMFSYMLIVLAPPVTMLGLKLLGINIGELTIPFLLGFLGEAFLIPVVFAMLQALLTRDAERNSFGFFFKKHLWILLSGYVLFMIYRMFFFAPADSMGTVQVIPFATFAGYIEAVINQVIELKVLLFYLLYTIGSFVPFGYIIAAVMGRMHVAAKLLVALLLPVISELLPLIMGKSAFDIDAVFFGFLGGLLGLGIFQLLDAAFMAVCRAGLKGNTRASEI